jgi:O-antigen/teichoic acid export membrane protein
MSDKKNLVKNILSLGVVQIANYVLPLVSIPIIVRIIGPGNYGIINYYNSFIAYFILLINYGFDYSGTRYIAIQKDDVSKRNLHFTKILYAKILLFIVSAVAFTISIIFITQSPNKGCNLYFFNRHIVGAFAQLVLPGHAGLNKSGTV